MKKMFLTKVWGYDPANWPILAFSTFAGANKLLREYSSGDWIVVAGTLAYPTAPEDQGRLLGIVQVTNTIVDVQAVLTSLGTKLDRVAFRDEGEFRWPYGFPFLVAKSFTLKPVLKEVLPGRSSQIGRAEAAFALELSQQETEVIRTLQTVVVEFPIAEILQPQLRLQRLLTGSGPPPALGERTAQYEDGDNVVYVFAIKGTGFYKIGRTSDIRRRLHEFNSSPHAIWADRPLEIVNSHRFSSAADAHAVEQMLHNYLEKYARGYECYLVSRPHIVFTALANMVAEYSARAR